MAVAPGLPVTLADLQALAAQANAAIPAASRSPSSASFFYSGPAIVGAGVKYKPGDVLADQYGHGLQLEVCSVRPGGALLGLKIISPGQFGAADATPSPMILTGGSGSGAIVRFTRGTYGPNVAYAFEQWLVTSGAVTDYYVASGGVDYRVGDLFTIPELVLTQMRATGVDGTGKLLTFDTLAGSGIHSVPQDVANMAARGGHGAGLAFGGFWTLDQTPTYLTELNRIRADAAALPSSASAAQLTRSGPWPRGGFTGGGGFDINSNQQSFFYEYKGTLATLSLGTWHSYIWKTQPYTYTALNYGGSRPGGTSGVVGATYRLHIRPFPGCTCTGAFSIHTARGTGPVHGAITLTTDIPGVTITGGTSGSFTNQFIPEGDYTISAGGGYVNNTSTDYLIIGSFCNGLNYGDDGAGTDLALQGGITFSPTTFTGGVPAPAIDANWPVYRLDIPFQYEKQGYGVTVTWCPVVEFGINMNPFGGDILGPPITNGPDGYFDSVTTNVNGFWYGTTSMVANLNAPAPAQMPWNFLLSNGNDFTQYNPALLGGADLSGPTQPGKTSNSYAQTVPVEEQLEPPLWLATKYFTAGFQIMDSNGNIQQAQNSGLSGSAAPKWGQLLGASTVDGRVNWLCLKAINPFAGPWQPGNTHFKGDTIKDPNGNIQLCAQGGRSSFTAPVWPVAQGATTLDGTVIWQTRRVATITPAVARPSCVPAYPAVWASENVPWYALPTTPGQLTQLGSYEQWNGRYFGGGIVDPGWNESNAAFGWWIYSVALSSYEPGQDVDVTIGCMRSGSFTAFGVYRTGKTYKVAWPVFTSNALVYQCSKRVNLQATAIAAGGAGVTTGTAAGGALMTADFYTDTVNVLNFVSVFGA